MAQVSREHRMPGRWRPGRPGQDERHRRGRPVLRLDQHGVASAERGPQLGGLAGRDAEGDQRAAVGHLEPVDEIDVVAASRRFAGEPERSGRNEPGQQRRPGDVR
jgi:hypothetical protein